MFVLVGAAVAWWVSSGSTARYSITARSASGQARVSYETVSGTSNETVRTPWSRVVEVPSGRSFTFSVAAEGAACEIADRNARIIARLEGDHVHCTARP
jgi:hypothetical protein